MTPLEQTFWCQRFSSYMDYEELTIDHYKRREAGKQADLDLEEFRKRFGGSDIPDADYRQSLEKHPGGAK